MFLLRLIWGVGVVRDAGAGVLEVLGEQFRDARGISSVRMAPHLYRFRA